MIKNKIKNKIKIKEKNFGIIKKLSFSNIKWWDQFFYLYIFINFKRDVSKHFFSKKKF